MPARRKTITPLPSPCRRCVSTFAVALLLCLAHTAPAETPSTAPSQWVDTVAWTESNQVARMVFTEERLFPFRKFPKRFSGEIFRAPNGELALNYTEPKQLKLLLLNAGVFLVDDGQVQKLPDDAGSVRILQELFSADKAALAANWQAETTDNSIRLRPKNKTVADALKRIDLSTEDGRVATVAVYLKDGVVRTYTFSAMSFGSEADFGNPFAQP